MERIKDYMYALDESSIVAITDQKGIIKYVNDNFCKISKYSVDELIGQDHRIVSSGHHPKAFIRKLWTTIAKGNVWKGEIKNKAKDGTTYWVDTTIVPFLNRSGKPYKYVAIRSDVTERKRVEEQIRKSNEKAIEYARMLEHQNTQLVDFCSIVSHNLRAPLVNMSMLVDFIEQSQDEPERKEVLAKMRPVMDHLMDVFNELVESLQVKQDAQIESDQVILKDCLDRVLRGFEAQIKEYGADIQLNLDQISTICFPQKYMESILTNLIGNALKYSSPKRRPKITVSTKKEAGNVVILSVADNGLGIDLERHKDQVFKIRKTFHKHPDARGFGLFMTKTQVEAMDGRIWVESQPGKGSTFLVEFKNQNT